MKINYRKASSGEHGWIQMSNSPWEKGVAKPFFSSQSASQTNWFFECMLSFPCQTKTCVIFSKCLTPEIFLRKHFVKLSFIKKQKLDLIKNFLNCQTPHYPLKEEDFFQHLQTLSCAFQKIGLNWEKDQTTCWRRHFCFFSSIFFLTLLRNPQLIVKSVSSSHL